MILVVNILNTTIVGCSLFVVPLVNNSYIGTVHGFIISKQNKNILFILCLIIGFMKFERNLEIIYTINTKRLKINHIWIKHNLFCLKYFRTFYIMFFIDVYQCNYKNTLPDGIILTKFLYEQKSIL